MTDEQKITMLKSLTGETSSEIISVYLALAKSELLNKIYPFGDGTEEFPAKYDALHVQATEYLLNKRGAEGEIQHSENGLTRSYESGGLPKAILQQIVPFCGVIF